VRSCSRQDLFQRPGLAPLTACARVGLTCTDLPTAHALAWPTVHHGPYSLHCTMVPKLHHGPYTAPCSYTAPLHHGPTLHHATMVLYCYTAVHHCTIALPQLPAGNGTERFGVHCTLHCTALHCTALHCTSLHCTASYPTALHCTA
jgi:hypothetical protein